MRGEDDDELSEEEDEGTATKKKVHVLGRCFLYHITDIYFFQKTGLTAEEIEQDEDITRLTRLYTCEDRSCNYVICYPAPPDAKHIHLTHLHLKTWATAIVCILSMCVLYPLTLLHIGSKR